MKIEIVEVSSEREYREDAGLGLVRGEVYLRAKFDDGRSIEPIVIVQVWDDEENTDDVAAIALGARLLAECLKDVESGHIEYSGADVELLGKQALDAILDITLVASIKDVLSKRGYGEDIDDLHEECHYWADLGAGPDEVEACVARGVWRAWVADALIAEDIPPGRLSSEFETLAGLVCQGVEDVDSLISAAKQAT